MKFSEKVKSMSSRGIVMAMVEGLRNPKIHIRMGTYGRMKNNEYFGCAATNTICILMEINPAIFLVENHEGFSNTKLATDDFEKQFIYCFESFIDQLRKGSIKIANYYAEKINLTPLPVVLDLPYLRSDYTAEELDAYEAYANTLN